MWYHTFHTFCFFSPMFNILSLLPASFSLLLFPTSTPYILPHSRFIPSSFSQFTPPLLYSPSLFLSTSLLHSFIPSAFSLFSFTLLIPLFHKFLLFPLFLSTSTSPNLSHPYSHIFLIHLFLTSFLPFPHVFYYPP